MHGQVLQYLTQALSVSITQLHIASNLKPIVIDKIDDCHKISVKMNITSFIT
jgi:hypothetical protein